MCLPIRLSSQDYPYAAFVFMKEKTKSRWISGVPPVTHEDYHLKAQDAAIEGSSSKCIVSFWIIYTTTTWRWLLIADICVLKTQPWSLQLPVTPTSIFPLKSQIEREQHGQGSKSLLGKKNYPMFSKQNTHIFHIFHLIVLLKNVPVMAAHHNHGLCCLFWYKSLRFWSDLFMVTF